nr:isoform 2 of endoribonuclease dicer like 4 [Quercus suber]
MGHGMLDSRDDHPIASSTGFCATTTTTRSLGVFGVEADDDDGVEQVSELKRSKKSHKDHLKACKPLEENIIFYLGTVCGKTHIAVLLIHKLSHLIRKPRKKVCIFSPLRWLWFSRLLWTLHLLQIMVICISVSLAMLWTCIFPWMKEWAEVCPRCHHDMPLVDFGTCLGLIGTHVGSRSIKGKSLRNSLLSQRNSRILGEVNTEESIQRV